MPQNSKFRYYTLLFLRCGNELLLGYKRRGFANEFFHGYGGKMNNAETKEQCIVREMFEESGINIQEDNLKFLGFTVHKEAAQIPRVVFIFTLTTLEKPEASETEEMRPQWFDIDNMPYDSMLPDNKHYLPYVLDNKLFIANFTLDSHKNVLNFNIEKFTCMEKVMKTFYSKYSNGNIH